MRISFSMNARRAPIAFVLLLPRFLSALCLAPSGEAATPPDAAPVILIQNTTVMTVSHGTIEHGSILIRDGKIAEIGQSIKAPAGAQVIDASRQFVIPGIIDCHSHIAAEAINEGSVSVSSMVNMEEVLDPDDIDIYRDLAGGVTSANILHGSANSIGGQTLVIKLRWGQPASKLPSEGAMPGIKFALGENPKRANFSIPGQPRRYPPIRHVLQGYKVADEFASAGVAASTFSDGWAYKVEAYDAIPSNAALMTRRGVIVSITSDDAEEATHLNQEAAKSMKYGSLSQDEALKLVTLNPAIQLGIDKRVGSIDVGKDADLAIYNRDPLSAYAVVQKTLIDGRIYFDLQRDIAERAERDKEKKALIDKFKKAAEKKPEEKKPDAASQNPG